MCVLVGPGAPTKIDAQPLTPTWIPKPQYNAEKLTVLRKVPQGHHLGILWYPERLLPVDTVTRALVLQLAGWSHIVVMAVNEHRPTVAEFKFDVKEGGTPSSATFIFG